MTVSDADIQASAAANMVAAASAISDINATITNTASMNGDSGILENISTLFENIATLKTYILSPGCAATPDGTQQWFFEVASDGTIGFKHWTTGGGWSAWNSLTAPAGVFVGAPTACCDNARLHVYCQCSDGNIWTRAEIYATGVWGTWVNLG